MHLLLLHLDMPRPMGGLFFSEEKGRRNREGEGEGTGEGSSTSHVPTLSSSASDAFTQT